MGGIRDLRTLKVEYKRLRPVITSRIKSFQQRLYRVEESELFCELVYVLLAAGSSATSALRGEKELQGIYETNPLLSRKVICQKLRRASCRFHTVKGGYIHSALIFFKQRGLRKTLLTELKSGKENLRDFLVANIKGMGYKASSHFLRNIGVFGLAILDKHIVNSMRELGLVEADTIAPVKRDDYLKMENIFRGTAEDMGFTVEELDLLLWGLKTGKILK